MGVGYRENRDLQRKDYHRAFDIVKRAVSIDYDTEQVEIRSDKKQEDKYNKDRLIHYSYTNGWWMNNSKLRCFHLINRKFLGSLADNELIEIKFLDENTAKINKFTVRAK